MARGQLPAPSCCMEACIATRLAVRCSRPCRGVRWRCAAAHRAERFAGVDLSYVNEMEACGARVPRATARCATRTSCSPTPAPTSCACGSGTRPTGRHYSTEADVTRSIERAHKAGMKVLLDFHYSDDWADPAEADHSRGLGGGHRRPRQARARTSTNTRATCWRGSAHAACCRTWSRSATRSTRRCCAPRTPRASPIDWARNAKILNAGMRAVREARAADGSSPEGDAARGAAGKRRALVRRRGRRRACATSTTSASATTRSGRRWT